MFVSSIYYLLKPLIPRSVQLRLRRDLVRHKREKFADVWPIDERAGKTPDGWKGWPGQKRFALVLTHDVDTVRGARRCNELAELEERLGFRSSFNFVPKRYRVPAELLETLKDRGFEVGVHGLLHDGKYQFSRKLFRERARKINEYLKEWGAVGFRAPSMFHNLEWFLDLDIEYDASTFDTDPFEPQPDGVGTIYPFWVEGSGARRGYVELPYTLAQDFTLFILMQEKDDSVWRRKLDWLAEKGGMVLLNTHPDYMNFGDAKTGAEEYPAARYEEFLIHLKQLGEDNYWHALPRDLARWWVSGHRQAAGRTDGRRP
ncbi:MAG: hypothetical protein ACM31N_02685 [Deltaproteobacteria bacterium]